MDRQKSQLAKHTYRGFTDIQRAAMFYVQIKISYGAGVVIEHKDFEDLIRVYNRPGALFYCDPPYYKTEKYYDVEFESSDHERLNKHLKEINGGFYD